MSAVSSDFILGRLFLTVTQQELLQLRLTIAAGLSVIIMEDDNNQLC